MIVWLRHFLGWVVGAFRSREDLILENLALRQQLLALHAQRPRRRLTAAHKLFWVVLRKCWARWKEPLIQVTPRTVVGWHRAGFRLYWKWLSRAQSRGGRKPVSKQIRALFFKWLRKIHLGERPAFMASCSSSTSIYRSTAPNGPSRGLLSCPSSKSTRAIRGLRLALARSNPAVFGATC